MTSDFDVLDIIPANSHIAFKGSVFVPWMHPGGLVFVGYSVKSLVIVTSFLACIIDRATIIHTPPHHVIPSHSPNSCSKHLLLN